MISGGKPKCEPRTFGYARVSTQSQADQGDSLDVQRQKIQGRAAMDGWPLAKVYVDRGVSGATPLAKRPQGGALLQALQPGDRLIIAKLDRGFRNASDALATLQDFRQRGIGLHLLDLGADDACSNGISGLIFGVLSAVSQFERDRIAERQREAKAFQRAQGRYLGGSAPFGYRLGPGRTLVPHPVEQRAIRKILSLRGKGASYHRCAAEASKIVGRRLGHVVAMRACARAEQDA